MIIQSSASEERKYFPIYDENYLIWNLDFEAGKETVWTKNVYMKVFNMARSHFFVEPQTLGLHIYKERSSGAR